MILAIAVVVSFLIGLIRTGGRLGGLGGVRLRSVELVFIAFALQVPLLRSPACRVEGPFATLSLLFLLSYPLLLIFVWRNRHLAGTWLLGLGVMLNLLVIVANGGFMPVAPDTLVKLRPDTSSDQWEIGLHRRYSKGIILEKSDTRLWELSDIFVLPPPFPIPAAFSVGDVCIAAGAFLLLQEAMVGGSEGGEDDAARIPPSP